MLVSWSPKLVYFQICFLLLLKNSGSQSSLKNSWVYVQKTFKKDVYNLKECQTQLASANIKLNLGKTMGLKTSMSRQQPTAPGSDPPSEERYRGLTGCSRDNPCATQWAIRHANKKEAQQSFMLIPQSITYRLWKYSIRFSISPFRPRSNHTKTWRSQSQGHLWAHR